MDHGALGAWPPWAELPTDALSEVTLHLRDATDLVRFHAVCRRWRQSPPPPRAPRLLPWLIAEPRNVLFSSGLRICSPFSGKSLYLPHAPDLRLRKLECSDAAKGRVLAVGVYYSDPRAAFVNPLTGDATYIPLPPPPHTWTPRTADPTNHRAVLFHLLVAILRADETDRDEVTTVICPEADPKNLFSDAHERRAAALCWSGILRGGTRAMAKLPPVKPFVLCNRYLLEFQGELICVDVGEESPWAHPPHELVSVYAMEVGDDGQPRWAEREHRRDADGHVCFFLGWESSFAMDAREFACAEVTGGCAYFVGRHPKCTPAKPVYGVYRYSFEDGMATVVNELPDCFNMMSMWFIPRPKLRPHVG